MLEVCAPYGLHTSSTSNEGKFVSAFREVADVPEPAGGNLPHFYTTATWTRPHSESLWIIGEHDRQEWTAAFPITPTLSRLLSQVSRQFNVKLLRDRMSRRVAAIRICEDFFMFGRFFNTAGVDEFADWVVDEVKRTLPASYDPALRDVSGKVDRLDRRIAERTASFTAVSRLNLFQKARLASRIRERMSAFGYPKPFVETFSIDVVKRVIAASRNRQPNPS